MNHSLYHKKFPPPVAKCTLHPEKVQIRSKKEARKLQSIFNGIHKKKFTIYKCSCCKQMHLTSQKQ